MTLARADQSALVIVDIQDKLAPAMPPDARREVLATVRTLLTAAGQLSVPVVATEQYPKGLGETLPDVSGHFPADAAIISKDSFSCCGEPGFTDALAATGRNQVVIAGMEAHVCVTQTAVELLEAGYTPFVVADGVCSRRPAHRDNALDRLRAAGVVVTNVESTLFEWLQRAGTEDFRKLSKLIR
jgi:nicotinamidase-related amidase